MSENYPICVRLWLNLVNLVNSISPQAYLDGLAQDCSNSIANALELLQSWRKPLIWSNAFSPITLLNKQSSWRILETPHAWALMWRHCPLLTESFTTAPRLTCCRATQRSLSSYSSNGSRLRRMLPINNTGSWKSQCLISSHDQLRPKTSTMSALRSHSARLWYLQYVSDEVMTWEYPCITDPL